MIKWFSFHLTFYEQDFVMRAFKHKGKKAYAYMDVLVELTKGYMRNKLMD